MPSRWCEPNPATKQVKRSNTSQPAAKAAQWPGSGRHFSEECASSAKVDKGPGG